ncbi:pyridoxamine 5'-phosphate oxidase family protein [Paenibacillus sp. JCM 10914]|uniref:hypothetical protein n=1 Tax=Paenibacillus sp. JCM 10914 TaxID=1236974 RepID=UPI0003CC86F4|nr:hypothetical protein [Paenibacillus sp. JCM 10914]GAE06115.1 hypothetical protein JCM10914_2259 [Paenibacillus sp. JCM 10914]
MAENAALSEELYQWLSGNDLDSKQYTAMLLLSTTEDGWPHTAMISVGEIVALDPAHLRLGLWHGTVTTGNLLRTGRATLVAIHEGVAHYVRMRLLALPDLPQALHPRQRFAADIVHVREDVAKYADILSGVTVRLHKPDEVLQRWEHSIQELLK